MGLIKVRSSRRRDALTDGTMAMGKREKSKGMVESPIKQWRVESMISFFLFSTFISLLLAYSDVPLVIYMCDVCIYRIHKETRKGIQVGK